MKNLKSNNQREFLPSFGDLVDALSIDQIKEIKLKNKDSYSKEIKNICHDIDLLIEEKQIQLSARLIRLIIIIAQMNLYIWENKDKMQEDPKKYNDLLKLAHQLNGIRNKTKNLLLKESQEIEPSKIKTNTKTDDLKDWDISIE